MWSEGQAQRCPTPWKCLVSTSALLFCPSSPTVNAPSSTTEHFPVFLKSVLWTWATGTSQWGQQWAKCVGGGITVICCVGFSCIHQNSSDYTLNTISVSFLNGINIFLAGKHICRTWCWKGWTFLKVIFTWSLQKSFWFDGTMAPKGLKLRLLIWDVASKRKITPNFRELWFSVWRVVKDGTTEWIPTTGERKRCFSL